MGVKYTPEQRTASNRYSSLKSRVDYDLEKYWLRKNFIDWYLNETKKCCYCGCTSEQLNEFYKITHSKRKSTRGKALEIERKEDKPYSEENCELCCYWCNNAKSDVFSAEEFSCIGKAIGSVVMAKIQAK